MIKNVSFDTIYKIVKLSDKNIVKDITLFDVYQGDKLPQGKKSYAISIKIQDETQTLTDAKIEALMSKITQTLEQEVQAQLR